MTDTDSQTAPYEPAAQTPFVFLSASHAPAETSGGSVLPVSSTTDTPQFFRVKKLKRMTHAANAAADTVNRSPDRRSGLLAAARMSALLKTGAPMIVAPYGGDPISATSAVVWAMPMSNATAPLEEFLVAATSVRLAFAEARRLAGEDRDELYQSFTATMEALLRRFGRVAFEIIGRIILVEGVDAKLGLSALRAAGHVRDQTAQETRRLLAEQALRSSVPEIRYGALHLLADLGGVSALAELTEAAKHEGIAALRADIERLIALLSRR